MKQDNSDFSAGTRTKDVRVTVKYQPIAGLTLNPRNPREHSRAQIRRIARSIDTYGFLIPVLVGGDDNVIAGHGRIMAARQLGWTEIPVISIEHLTEAQARAFMIADNRLTEISSWNDRVLAEQLKELAALDLDFDLEATGFDMGEIDLRIQGLEAQQAEHDPADALPQQVPGPPVTQSGDLWVLDRHRVYCGSALDRSGYKTLMDAKKAPGAFTDPPYNMRIPGNVSGLGAVEHREFAMASGEMTEAEFTAFLNKVFSLLTHYSTDGSLHFICMDWRHMGELLNAARGIYSELKNLCVWTKDRAGMGSLYRSQHELVFVFKNSTERHRNNVQLGQYGRDRSNVWQYPCAASFSRSGDEGNLLQQHPTVKPVAMVADAIMDCTARGDIVLDPFLGSGTTVIAAERTGRRCFGIEIDPTYVDVIVRRWQAFTRGDAIEVASGRTFNELATERSDANGGR